LSLSALGGTSQGPMDRRLSACGNQGDRASSVSSGRAKRSRQSASKAEGVGKEPVQFTVVLPPTQRICRMDTALSAVMRLAHSWWRVV